MPWAKRPRLPGLSKWKFTEKAPEECPAKVTRPGRDATDHFFANTCVPALKNSMLIICTVAVPGSPPKLWMFFCTLSSHLRIHMYPRSPRVIQNPGNSLTLPVSFCLRGHCSASLRHEYPSDLSQGAVATPLVQCFVVSGAPIGILTIKRRA